MRSKNKKHKSAYRRGEKLRIFFKRGAFFLLIVVFFLIAVPGVKYLARKVQLREILVSGNFHLDKKDIISGLKIRKDALLFDLQFEDIDKELRQNPWIKKVALRKQFPGTLMIKVEEATPTALLRIKKRLYLVDEDGTRLERIKGESPPFLPVIKDINPKNRKAVSEALKLVKALTERDFFSNREFIEIGLESYGLAIKVDGDFFKVGYGDYSEKLNRWAELEPEIRKRGVLIQYVDLRFKDSVIVKPMKTIKSKTTS